MRDGLNVSSSLYAARLVTLVLEVRTTTSQDNNATQMQLLARELDRAGNFLKYQPNGLTKPVFFVVLRSDISNVQDVPAQAAMREVTVDLLCEPFALGLREDIASANVANAATGTDLVLAVTGIIGDVVAPAVVWTDSSLTLSTVALSNSLKAPVLLEAEVDTTTSATVSNVTADATYSNSAGKRWTPAASGSLYTVFVALTIPAGIPAGNYKVYARVKKSVAGDTWIAQVQADSASSNADDFTLAASTEFQMVDMGYLNLSSVKPGHAAAELPLSAQQLTFQVGRPSGSGTLDLDFLALVPADNSTAHVAFPSYASKAWVADAVSDDVYLTTAGGPFAGGAELAQGWGFTRSGALVSLSPGVTNYLCLVRLGDGIPVSTTTGLNLSYWPAYLRIRPSAT